MLFLFSCTSIPNFIYTSCSSQEGAEVISKYCGFPKSQSLKELRPWTASRCYSPGIPHVRLCRQGPGPHAEMLAHKHALETNSAIYKNQLPEKFKKMVTRMHGRTCTRLKNTLTQRLHVAVCVECIDCFLKQNICT